MSARISERDIRPCPECGGEMIRTNPGKGRFPSRCAECRGEATTKKGSARPEPETPVEPETEAGLDAIGVITAFKLDYLVGSAARFLLESKDGDELENLQNARIYLDRAIAERAS